MKKIGIWCVLAATVALVSTASCGKGTKRKEPAPTALESQPAALAPSVPASISARDLGLRVVMAGADPKLPDLSSGSASLVPRDKQVINEETISFTQKIPLGKKPVFFIWHEDALEGTIVDAHYEHRVISALNIPGGEPLRLSVPFDKDARVWFIPFDQLFKGVETSVSGADQQTLVLDLHLGNGGRKQVTLLFQVLGRLPDIRLMHLPRLNPAQHQWALAHEIYDNSTTRDLQLWVRPGGEQELTMSNYLLASGYQGRAHEPPLGPLFTRLQSNARYQLKELQVRIGEKVERIILADDRWVAIRFPARSRVDLTWVAAVAPGTAQCQAPGLAPKTYGWATAREVCTRSSREFEGVCNTHWDTHFQGVSEGTVSTGHRFHGQWKHEVRLADPFLTPELAMAEKISPELAPYLKTLFEGIQPLNDQVGSGGEGGEVAFGCQGYF